MEAIHLADRNGASLRRAGWTRLAAIVCDH
jgi:hypothetical protein